MPSLNCLKCVGIGCCVAIAAILVTGIVLSQEPQVGPTYPEPASPAEIDELVELAVEHRRANQWYDDRPVEDIRAEVRNGLIENEDFCQTMHSKDSYEFCSISIGVNVLREWRTLRKGMRSSKWTAETNFQRRYMKFDKAADYFPPNNPTRWKEVVDALHDQEGKETWGTKVHDQTHAKTNFRGERGTWHVERVGPFIHKGADEWHHLWFDSFKDLRMPGPGHVGSWLQGSLMAIVQEDGEIIGYPPAHMHHFHLYGEDALAPIAPWVHFLGTETHGDASCEQAGLGALCYMQMFPRGYGFFHAEDYFFDSLVNFVTPAQDTVNGDKFYFQAAVYVADKDDPPAIGFPVPIFVGMADFNPVQQPEAHTYRVPKDRQSMSWQTSEPVPFDVEVLWTKLHSHWYYTNEFMVVSAPEEALGLGVGKHLMVEEPCTKPEDWPYDSKPTVVSHPDKDFCDPKDSPIPAGTSLGRLYELETAGYTIDEMKFAILGNLTKHRSETGEGGVILRTTADHKGFKSVVGNNTVWSRPLLRPADPFYKAGTQITAIGFYEPMHDFGDKLPVRQHLKSIFWCKPASGIVRWIVSSPTSRLLTWYGLKFPIALLVPVVFLSFLAFHLVKYVKFVMNSAAHRAAGLGGDSTKNVMYLQVQQDDAA